MRRKRNHFSVVVLVAIFWLAVSLINRFNYNSFLSFKNADPGSAFTSTTLIGAPPISLEDIPPYESIDVVEINGNKPYFDSSDYVGVFEHYSDLDLLGRCGVASCAAGIELRPTEERGSIGNVKPSGWNQAKYPGIVPTNPAFVYHRCHLIAFSIAGELDNQLNLITGTEHFNEEGMLVYEKKVLEYIDDNPDNHVLYRVTPMFEGVNLVASGVLMEACSVEDDGCVFCVFIYNVEPGVEIDYLTGETWVVG